MFKAIPENNTEFQVNDACGEIKKHTQTEEKINKYEVNCYNFLSGRVCEISSFQT